jgi:hypothetical protein
MATAKCVRRVRDPEKEERRRIEEEDLMKGGFTAGVQDP